MKFSYSSLKDEYTKLWESVKINPSFNSAIDRSARRIIANKTRYDAISELTGVPWDIIGVIHMRESNLNFNTHLHNGDSLARRTYHVPAGRPKDGKAPFTFEVSAVDALTMKGWDKITDWDDISRQLYELERYNGFGYRSSKKRPHSPYLWAGTNQYTKGKYVKDGVYSASTVDSQLGTVAVLIRIRELEKPKATLKEQSGTFRTLGRVKNSIYGFFGSIFAGIAALFSTENFNQAISWLTQVNGIIAPYWFLIMLAGGSLMWVLTNYAMNKRIKEFREGRYSTSRPTDLQQDSTDELEDTGA